MKSLQIIYLIWVVVSIEGTFGKTVQGRGVYLKRENNYSDNDDDNVNYDNVNYDNVDDLESSINNDSANRQRERSEESNILSEQSEGNNEETNESSDSQSNLLTRRSSINSTFEDENKFSDVDNNDIEQSNEQVVPRKLNNEASENRTSAGAVTQVNGSSSDEVDHTGHGHVDEVSRRKCLFLLPVLAKAAAVKAKIIKNRLTANFRPPPPPTSPPETTTTTTTTTERPTTRRLRATTEQTTTTRLTTTVRPTIQSTTQRTPAPNRPSTILTLTSRRITSTGTTPRPCGPTFTHSLGHKQDPKGCKTPANESVTITSATTPSQPPVTIAPYTTPSQPPVTITPSTTSSKPLITNAPLTTPSKPPVTIAPSTTSSEPPVTVVPSTTSSKPPVTIIPSSTSSKPSVTSEPSPLPPVTTTSTPITSSTNKPIIYEVCKPSCCKPPRQKPLQCSMYHNFCTNQLVPQLNIQAIYQNFCYYNKIINEYCYYYNLYYQRNNIIQSPCTSQFHLQNMQYQGYRRPKVNDNNNNKKGENRGRHQDKSRQGYFKNKSINMNTNINKNRGKLSGKNKKKTNNNSLEMSKENSPQTNDQTLSSTDEENSSSEMNKLNLQKNVAELVINGLPPNIKNQTWTHALVDKIVAEKLNDMDLDKKNDNDDSNDSEAPPQSDGLIKQREPLLGYEYGNGLCNCENNQQSSIYPPEWYFAPPPWYYQPPPLQSPFTPSFPPSFPPMPSLPFSPYCNDYNNGYDNIYFKKYGFNKNMDNKNRFKYDEKSKYKINIDKVKTNCNNLIPVIEEKPKDYTFVDGIGWLKIHHVPKTWNEARKECIREGAHLAVINSAREAKMIVNSTYPADQFIFVGIHGFYGNHDWESIFDTPLESTGFSQWTKNVPSKQGYCGALDKKTGLLTNPACLTPYPFVCKIPIDGPWKTTCSE